MPPRDLIMEKHYQDAKKEGRLCQRCGWYITKKRWKKGQRLCGSCEDALKGVNVSYGHPPYSTEARNRNGDIW
jgi:hypothetical protein